MIVLYSVVPNAEDVEQVIDSIFDIGFFDSKKEAEEEKKEIESFSKIKYKVIKVTIQDE